MTHRTLSTFILLLLALPVAAQWMEVHPGVTYQHILEDSLDVHVTRVDLHDNRIRVVATREEDRGTRVSEFAKRTRAIAAINGDYFDEKLFPKGLTIGGCGQWEGTRDTRGEGFVAVGARRARISRQSEVVDPPDDWIDAAVSGWPALVNSCEVVEKLPGSDAFTRSPHPRTAVGLSKDRRYLYLVVADGRRPGIPGMTLPQLAEFMAERIGACSAINLDGGGSSAMWVEDEIVNRPSDGSERRVSNHLAVVAARDYVECERKSVPMISSTSVTKTTVTRKTTTTSSPGTPVVTKTKSVETNSRPLSQDASGSDKKTSPPPVPAEVPETPPPPPRGN